MILKYQSLFKDKSDKAKVESYKVKVKKGLAFPNDLFNSFK